MKPHRVLVLCTGNSCRSILAEGLINHLGGVDFDAVSAGSNPAGFVHPESIATLARYDIVVEDARSKSWDEFADQSFDFVITVCDQAASETCPVFLGDVKKLHWSTPDPAKVTGSEAEIRDAFDSAFESLKQRIQDELIRVMTQ